MRKVVVDENNLTSIANAIRNKNGETTTYKPNQMASAIDNIETSVKPTETIEITKNGVYDVVNYATANVNTPEPKEEQSKTITITENGTQNITPDENKVLSNVEVITEVPVGVFPTGNIEIIENGTYDVTNYASANVDVPSKIIQPKTITENGVYNATDDGVDGYDVVTVETEKYAPRFISFADYTGTELDYELNNLDVRNITSTKGMFLRCIPLKTIASFDTSKVTDMSSMFSYCASLVSIPLYNTSEATNMSSMFSHCETLQTIPLYDTSKATNMSSMFSYCFALKEMPPFNTSNNTTMGSMFQYCNNVQSFPEFDAGKVTSVNGMFMGGIIATEMGGFKDLGKAYSPTSSANYSSYRLDISYCKKLTHESLMNVINKLYDIASIGVKTQQLKLGADNLAKVNEENIAIATNKGWTVVQ